MRGDEMYVVKAGTVFEKEGVKFKLGQIENDEINGGQEGQVRDRVKREGAILGQIWGIEKRRFGGDWEKRIWLFDALVWSVVSYGVEIWEWKKREKMERLQERYLRWVLGVDWGTPGYLIMEELQRDKLRGRMRKRAWGYERRLEERKGEELARNCWEEVKRRALKGGEKLSE
ncbi:hypothetical protein RF55_14979 [Lasius niger]|uniref:Uncharacterized protein n=1 Tax=Lasius niger TaxID=67767 RepID=A0A0J7K701_LASNI|nr:hypothetical protein RF55_14979 [Lasius niger]